MSADRTLIASGRDTTRAPSQALWKGIKFEAIREGYLSGYARHVELTEFKQSTNVNAAEAYWGCGFNLFGDNGAAVAALDTLGGGRTFGSDGDNEGASFRLAGAPFQLDRGKKDFALEMLVQSSTITDTKHGILLGLIEDVALTAIIPITAAGAVADKNCVYFRRDETDGDNLDTGYKADGQTAATVKADCLTGSTYRGGVTPSALVAATDIKLGIRYTDRGHRAGDFTVSYWVNGIELPDTYQVTATAGNPFPNDVRLCPFFAVLNATGTTPGTTSVKWIRFGQAY